MERIEQTGELLPQKRFGLDKVGIVTWILNHMVWFILVFVIAGLSLGVEGFGQWGIYRNILYHSVFVGILALGEAMVIISKEMDLSIGSVAGLGAIITAWLTGTGMDAAGFELNGYLALLVVMMMGVGIGLFQAMFVVKWKISSFIVTLAGYLMFRALALVVTSGHGVTWLRPEVTAVAKIRVGPLPMMVIVMIIIYLFFYLFLTQTRTGQYIYLVGDNREAAYNAGIRIERVLFGVFALSGMLAALTGWLLAAKINGAHPSTGTGMLFEAMAAVVVGGVSLQGGVGNLSGVLAGAILLSAISTAVTLLGMPPFYMNVLRGGFILFAVSLDAGIRYLRHKLT